MLALNIRGECWWYGSRGWTFPPMFYHMLLLCDRWQQRGSLTECCLTWKCGWSKNCKHWITAYGKKCHSLTFISDCWTFMEMKQWMWTQWGGGWCVSAVVAVTVGHLCWCSFLWAWHAALVRHWQKCIANGGDCVEKKCFVAKNLLYQIVLLYSLYLMLFPWKSGIISRAIDIENTCHLPECY